LAAAEFNPEEQPMKAVSLVLVLTLSSPVMAQRPREEPPGAEKSVAEPARGDRSRADQPRTDAPRSAESRAEESRPSGTRTRNPESPAAVAQGLAVTPVAEKVDEKPVVTHHKITAGGRTLEYTVTVAQMPLKDAAGETEAHIFYMAYTLDGVADASKRPVTFAFNGGPGSASIWVHMGAMGPRSAKLLDNGDMPPPPFQLIDNEHTWLTETDLVFIDPVGTGYSRAKNAEVARRLNGVQGDLQSVGEFIRLYITRNDRWLSPLFIAGESYGTFRAAGLAGTLIEKGIAVNGIVLISTVLDFGLLRPSGINGLPYALQLPTAAADAWYHKRLAPELQKDLRATLKEVEGWAMSDYIGALNKGEELPPSERKGIVEKLARYTGLSPQYVDESELKIDSSRFRRELLRDKKLTIGGYDGRLTGPSPLNAGDRAEFDPSGTLVRPPIEAAFEHYISAELGYKTDMVYNVLVGLQWDWGSPNGYAETTSLLRDAFTKNPYLKVMNCAGYYDIVTPYFSVQYNLNHAGLHPEMHKNITYQYYEAGHMMYIDRTSKEKLKRDFADFVGNATKAK
jgi:carboxypeptidase C (cathepsin A)